VFATLLGGLPPPGQADLDTADLDAAVRAAISAQEAAGLEPITDGRLRDPGFEQLAGLLTSGAHGDADRAAALAVETWTAAARMTDRAVKQALPGPYTLGWRVARRDRAHVTGVAADGLAVVVEALRRARCPLAEIEETELHRIGEDPAEQALYREAHRRLTGSDGDERENRREIGRETGGIHRSLSIVGGSAADAGVETILEAPYASLALDLIAGPESWNIVTRAPAERGIIVGALSARDEDEARELLVWGAHYAATNGRGRARVGLGSAGSYANLTWAVALRKIRHLGEAARLAGMARSEELVRSLDPAAVSLRRAALGHDAPAPPRPRRTVR
jgi:hypothetical protein